MDTLRIIAVLLVSAIACLVIRMHRPEYASVLTIAIGVCAFVSLLPQLRAVAEVFQLLSTVDPALQSFCQILLKVIGIAYLAQFASDVCNDCGERAIGQKITLAARVGILLLCLPALLRVMELIRTLLEDMP